MIQPVCNSAGPSPTTFDQRSSRWRICCVHATCMAQYVAWCSMGWAVVMWLRAYMYTMYTHHCPLTRCVMAVAYFCCALGVLYGVRHKSPTWFYPYLVAHGAQLILQAAILAVSLFFRRFVVVVVQYYVMTHETTNIWLNSTVTNITTVEENYDQETYQYAYIVQIECMIGFVLAFALHAWAYHVVLTALRFTQNLVESERFEQCREEACKGTAPPPYLIEEGSAAGAKRAEAMAMEAMWAQAAPPYTVADDRY